MTGTKVYGASDDLIEFAGEFQGETSPTSDKRATKVTLSDGTVLLVKYGKPKDGVLWWIRAAEKGSLFDRIDECHEETDAGYSDIAWFKPGIEWARVGGKRVR